jgi:hypothetical protein
MTFGRSVGCSTDGKGFGCGTGFSVDDGVVFAPDFSHPTTANASMLATPAVRSARFVLGNRGASAFVIEESIQQKI